MLNLIPFLKSFQDVSILVFGDVMLDRYLIGRVERVSPEAPVPVVDLEKETLVAGGAANVAANVAGLGASVTLLAPTGDDREAVELRGLLEGLGIGSRGILPCSSRETTVKNRILADGHQIARVDRESVIDLIGEDLESVAALFDEGVERADAVIISDYGKGIVSVEAATRLITKSTSAGVPVYVDPKGLNYSKYAGASLLTPNRKEALELFHAENREVGSIEQAGKHILDTFGLDNLVITLGAGGMALFQKNTGMESLSASARNVFDVTGAGDTVIATLAVSMAAGADLRSAAVIANAAAGHVVEKIGTSAIDRIALEVELDGIESGDTDRV